MLCYCSFLAEPAGEAAEMPGLSFLLKKKFHPARFDNQKRLFIAEQNQAEKNEREVQSAKEVMKEKEMQSYETMGAMEVRDPRSSALKFMYAAPQSKDQTEGKNVTVMASLQDYESKIDKATGDDDMVRAFKAKIIQSKLNKLADLSSSAASEEHVAGPTFIDPPQDLLGGHKASKSHAAPQQSALEREVGGRRSRADLTHTQLEERFACLKNAPMEGGYAKGIAVKHQPFNEVVRNVQCARCGEWGHRSGERECALKDYNPLDYARQQREDPMRNMAGPADPRGAGSSGARGVSSSSDAMRRSTVFVDENGESDPEAEFLASLTRREKMLLLRKLQVD